MGEHGKPAEKNTGPGRKKRHAKSAGKVIQLRLKRENIVDKCERAVGKVTHFLDQIAGMAIIAAVLLVVVNIILRIIPGAHPILGTYEFVGFLTVLIIGLSIAHCAFQNCHIAVGLLMDKFSPKVRTAVSFFIHLLSVIFLAFSSCGIAAFGKTIAQTGMVSPTTRTPFYPFIYVAALGIGILSAVLFVRMIKLTVPLFEKHAAAFQGRTGSPKWNQLTRRVKTND